MSRYYVITPGCVSTWPWHEAKRASKVPPLCSANVAPVLLPIPNIPLLLGNYPDDLRRPAIARRIHTLACALRDTGDDPQPLAFCVRNSPPLDPRHPIDRHASPTPLLVEPLSRLRIPPCRRPGAIVLSLRQLSTFPTGLCSTLSPSQIPRKRLRHTEPPHPLVSATATSLTNARC